MDTTRYIARHIIDLPKSGIRDFFEVVAKMKDVISLGIGEPTLTRPGTSAKPRFTPWKRARRITPPTWV